jgi:N-acetylmuramoyl-L-alanine amidase
MPAVLAVRVSQDNFFAASTDLAVRIGSQLLATGKRPSLHPHAERIEGERRDVIKAFTGWTPNTGLPRRPATSSSSAAAMPAVLLETGVIKHRDEELVVATKAFHADVARSITSALEQVCLEILPGYPAVRGG